MEALFDDPHRTACIFIIAMVPVMLTLKAFKQDSLAGLVGGINMLVIIGLIGGKF